MKMLKQYHVLGWLVIACHSYAMQPTLPLVVEAQQLKDMAFSPALVTRLQSIENTYSLERKQELIAAVSEHPALILLKHGANIVLNAPDNLTCAALDEYSNHLALGNDRGGISLLETLHFAQMQDTLPGTVKTYVAEIKIPVSTLPLKHVSFNDKGLLVADKTTLYSIAMPDRIVTPVYKAKPYRRIIVSRSGNALLAYCTCKAGLIKILKPPFKQKGAEWLNWANGTVIGAAFDQQSNVLYATSDGQLNYVHNKNCLIAPQDLGRKNSNDIQLDISSDGRHGLVAYQTTITHYCLSPRSLSLLRKIALHCINPTTSITCAGFRPHSLLMNVGHSDSKVSVINIYDGDMPLDVMQCSFVRDTAITQWVCSSDRKDEVLIAGDSLEYALSNRFSINDARIPLLSALVLIAKVHDEQDSSIVMHEYMQQTLALLKQYVPKTAELICNFQQNRDTF